MKRVPAELVILMLAQDGIQVNARQLRNWKLRGRISRGEGYDLQEIVDYLDRRNAPKVPKPPKAPASPKRHGGRSSTPAAGSSVESWSTIRRCVVSVIRFLMANTLSTMLPDRLCV